MLRPITLWPFCYAKIAQLTKRGVKGFLVVEMNAGQMLEDVELGVKGQAPVRFYGRMGGGIPSPEEIQEKLTALIKEES